MDLVCTIADLIVPGVGTTVTMTLSYVFRLCQSIKDNQSLCQRVHKRLHDVYEELEAMEKNNTLPNNALIAKYGYALARFLHYLETQVERQRNVFLRFAHARQALDELQELQQDIDVLFKLLNLAHIQQMTLWRREWEAEQLRHTKQMSRLLDHTTQLRDELQGKALAKALTMVKADIEQENDSDHGYLAFNRSGKVFYGSWRQSPKGYTVDVSDYNDDTLACDSDEVTGEGATLTCECDENECACDGKQTRTPSRGFYLWRIFYEALVSRELLAEQQKRYVVKKWASASTSASTRHSTGERMFKLQSSHSFSSTSSPKKAFKRSYSEEGS